MKTFWEQFLDRDSTFASDDGDYEEPANESERDDLEEMLRPVRDYLIDDKDVHWTRCPDMQIVVSKLLEYVDEDKFRAWLDSYAKTMNGE